MPRRREPDWWPNDTEPIAGDDAPRRVAPGRQPRATKKPEAPASPPPGGDIDRRRLRRLERGELAVEATLDLHGLDRREAVAALDRFLDGSRRAGRRVVLVVTGRGLHSPHGRSVLSSAVAGRLAGRSDVLASAPALPRDGGPGARYVLLRK